MIEGVSIPDHPRLLKELRLLERKTLRSGKDIVDHGIQGTDDFANAAAGCLQVLASYLGSGFTDYRWVDDAKPDPDAPAPRTHPTTMSAADYEKWSRPPALYPRELEEAAS